MAVYSDLTYPAIISDDAGFRTWGPKIGAALVAVGLVQTADTGQINWTTVLKPTVTNSSAGYEIYRFADALQATAPVFLKVEYGTGGGVTTPSIWITVGTATNGAGTISSAIISTRKQLDATTTQATPIQILCSGDTNRVMFVGINPNQSTNFTHWFSVERTKDNTGADTADGVAVIAASPATSYMYHLLPFGGAALPASIAVPPLLNPSSGGISIFGLDVAMTPPIYFIGKVLYGNAIMGYNNGDLQQLVPVTCTILGTARTYLPLGAAFNTATLSGISNPLAMRWE